MVMKKKLVPLFISIVIFIIPLTLHAQETEERVFDQAALFSNTEKDQLEENIANLIEQAELDIVVVTTEDNRGKSSADYSHDFYDDHSFGYGNTRDGILYLINMDEREIYIYTRDRSNDYFDDRRIDEVLDKVFPYLTEGQYAKSAETFLAEVERIVLTEGLLPSPAEAEEEENIWLELAIYFGISIVIGAAVIVIMILGNRGRTTVHEGTYLEEGSFQLTNRMDQYYTTTVTRQKIQRNNSSGGGGTRIGGGGRKF